jgi:excisionase family DNA binding protein
LSGSDTPPPTFVSVTVKSWGLKEAAAFLRIHPDTLALWAREGRIPGCKVGRSWVFMPELLEDYVLSLIKVPSPSVAAMGRPRKSLAERLSERLERKIAERKASGGSEPSVERPWGTRRKAARSP